MKLLSMLTVMVVLTVFAAGAKTEKIEETVVAQKDGVTDEREYLREGTSHYSRSVTNYIVHVSSRNERMVLTIKCTGGIRRGCFALTGRQSYPALFEYRRGKDSDFVWITGQPGGNLTKGVRMKSTVVNWEAIK